MNMCKIIKVLGERGIKPENLPPEEDIKKLERRVRAEEKKLTDKDKCFRENK